MCLLDTESIDAIGIEIPSRVLVLTLIDDCDWSDESGHLALLRAKINRYFDLIDSEEVFEHVRENLSVDEINKSRVKINIISRFEPTRRGKKIIEAMSVAAKVDGICVYFVLSLGVD